MIVTICGLAALVVAALARIALIDSLADQGYFGKYLILADQWRQGDVPVERFADVSVPYLILIRTLRGFLDPVGIRTLQIASTSLAALLCAVAAWRLCGLRAAALAGAALLASRGVLLNATEIEPETAILIAISAFLALLPVGDLRLRLAPAAGLAAGFAIALRPTFALPLALVLACLIARGRGRHRILVPALVTLGALLVILPFRSFSSERSTTTLAMNPGTVFYEGMNPWATGYSGVQPRIVNDLEPRIGQPDSLHIAYRFVASRAMGHNATPAETNAYWSGLALEYAREFPARAVALTARKVWFSLHSYDAWDLATLVRKERDLGWLPWLPFGLAVPMVVIGLFSLRERAGWLFGALLAGHVLAMAIFYVSARQRNVLWPIAAVLGAAGLHVLLKWIERRRWFHVAGAVLGTLIIAPLLSLDGHAQREDRYAWTASFESARHARLASAARLQGEAARATLHDAIDQSWLDDGDELERSPARIAVALRHQLATFPEPRQFDVAVALIRHDDPTARDLLATLSAEGYEPERGNVVVPSTAWQRAVLALSAGDPAAARAFLDEALDEAPGAPEVEATAALLGGVTVEEIERRLNEWNDPFTTRLALTRAFALTGRTDEAIAELEALGQELPEWNRTSRLPLQ